MPQTNNNHGQQPHSMEPWTTTSQHRPRSSNTTQPPSYAPTTTSTTICTVAICSFLDWQWHLHWHWHWNWHLFVVALLVPVPVLALGLFLRVSVLFIYGWVGTVALLVPVPRIDRSCCMGGWCAVAERDGLVADSNNSLTNSQTPRVPNFPWMGRCSLFLSHW